MVCIYLNRCWAGKNAGNGQSRDGGDDVLELHGDEVVSDVAVLRKGGWWMMVLLLMLLIVLMMEISPGATLCSYRPTCFAVSSLTFAIRTHRCQTTVPIPGTFVVLIDQRSMSKVSGNITGYH